MCLLQQVSHVILPPQNVVLQKTALSFMFNSCTCLPWLVTVPVKISVLKSSCSILLGLRMSRPVLPNRDLTKGKSVIVSGCQQRARARWLRYVAWWWWSRERKLTGFGNGFRHCLASVSMSQRRSEWNPKGSGSGMGTRRDRGTKDRDTGSILDDYQTEELETSVRLLILRVERENVSGQIIISDCMYGEERSI